MTTTPSPDDPTPGGIRPLGKVGTRVLVVASVLLAFALAYASAQFLIGTVRETKQEGGFDTQENVPPDSLQALPPAGPDTSVTERSPR